jgi:cysteine desulfurase
MAVRTPIYLDHHATTPVDPRVIDRMTEVLRDHFGNPSSSTHAFGWAAARLVDEAREQVAALIGATAREIVFTSGATESDNLAIKGVAAACGSPGRVVTTNVEHEAVSGPLEELSVQGWDVVAVPVDRRGLVDPDAVAAAIDTRTALVTVMAAQNEIGTLQPIGAIGALCKARGVLFHTDAAQAVGKVPVDVEADGIDLLSVAGHKLYAPKGVGALYVRRRDPRVRLVPVQTGGGQERGLRPGTLNVPGIVALGEACRIARLEMAEEALRLRGLRDRLLAQLRAELDGVHVNGDLERRLPGSLNVSFAGVRPHQLVGALTGLAVSTGSACSSAEGQFSPILAAIGTPPELAQANVRIGLGRTTTGEEIDFAAVTIVTAVRRLRAESERAGLAGPSVS